MLRKQNQITKDKKQRHEKFWAKEEEWIWYLLPHEQKNVTEQMGKGLTDLHMIGCKDDASFDQSRSKFLIMNCFKLTRQHRTILSQRCLFFLICFECLVTDDII